MRRCRVWGRGANSPHHWGMSSYLGSLPRIWVVAYKLPVHRLARRWANWVEELQRWGKARELSQKTCDEIGGLMKISHWIVEVGKYYCLWALWRIRMSKVLKCCGWSWTILVNDAWISLGHIGVLGKTRGFLKLMWDLVTKAIQRQVWPALSNSMSQNWSTLWIKP